MNFEEYFSRLKNGIEVIYDKSDIKNFGIHPELLSNFQNGFVNKKLLVDK